MFCREFSLVNENPNTILVNPLLCRSWGCDFCRPGRKSAVCREAAAGHPRIMVTLTVTPRWGESVEHRAEELVRSWRAFVKVAKKYYGYKTIPYFVVFEGTKQGEPHLHILCRVPWIDHDLLSDFMKARMKAPNVWIAPCTSDRNAARYVGKYIGKGPGKFGTCKRYWQTRDYQDPVEDDEYGGYRKPPPPAICRQTVDDWVFWARRVGYPVVIHRESCTITKRVPP